MHSFRPYPRPIGGPDEAAPSKSVRRRSLACPGELSIGDEMFEFRDDDSGKAGLIAIEPMPVLLPSLLAEVLLLVAEEKSDRRVLERAGVDGVLLLDTTGKGELDCK